MGNKMLPVVHQKSILTEDAANLGLLVFALKNILIPKIFISLWLEKLSKKKKRYVHFDFNIAPSKALNYLSNFQKITTHNFYPLIKFNKIERKYKKDKNKSSRGVIKKKIREIYYASHKDSLIYSWYAKILDNFYEHVLSTEEYKDSPTAYRKLGSKSNIDFALEVFKHIKNQDESVVITVDIKQFFDKLDHKHLKQSWELLLGEDILPQDHYKIYKSLTSFAFVEETELYKILKVKKNKRSYMTRLCSAEDFRSKVRDKGLIKTHEKKFGIPQGTPISSILSNIYMQNFDKAIYEYLKHDTFLYKRYSDDIVIVCERKDKIKVIRMLKNELKKIKLNLNPKKTNIILFKKGVKGISKGYSENGEIVNLQYLGFDFDGENYFIRSSSISRYYTRLKSSIKATVKNAKKSPNKIILKKNIYTKYSHLGERNFISYAYQASQKMNSKNIKRQIKKHMKIIGSSIKENKTKYNLH
ncbi:MAG TPA: antiviral reverse transcriptase Drt2 [Candidatus Saccharimonadales bacterium]|nr:antiviral reverse transcriptase Drt2 [Candidatus Saccharimonadales bacterium]